MKFSIILSFALVLTSLLSSCIEDDYATSPSQQPEFSTDTLRIGSVWAGEASPTARFTVYNHADANLRISSIAVAGAHADNFRINVDGMSGDSFSDVEIRPNDSIFVFAQAVLPANSSVSSELFEADLVFTTNGVSHKLPVKACAMNAVTIQELTISGDEIWDDIRPYRVMRNLTVAPGASLTLAPGTCVMLHDGAGIDVYGTLKTDGTAEQPIVFSGDRTGNVVADIPFDLMSRQWDGLSFHPSSTGTLSHTIVKNSSVGCQAEEANLILINCVLRNSGGDAFAATRSEVEAVGCEFAEAAGAAVRISGGSYKLSHCTLANFYLFAAQTDATLCIEDIMETKASIDNSIIYSRGADLNYSDLTATDITFHRCMLRSAGTDDANFTECIWDSDPLFITDRSKYIFDYRLRPESPAIGAADSRMTDPRAATDRYGLLWSEPADLGAYVFSEDIVSM